MSAASFELNEATLSVIAKIGASAQHLLGIINDILDMSHISPSSRTRCLKRWNR